MSFLKYFRGEAKVPEISEFKDSWPRVIALIYMVLGNNSFLIVVLNSTALALCAAFAAKTSLLFSAKEPRLLLVLYFSLSPFILFFGPSFGREAIFFLGTSLLVLGLAFLYKLRIVSAFSTLILGSVILMYIRFTLGVFVSYSIIIPGLVLLGISYIKSSKKISTTLILSSVAVASTTPLAISAANRYSEVATSNQISLSVYSNSGFISTSPEVNPVLDPQIQASPWLSWILPKIENFFHVSFGPFPHELSATSLGIFLGMNWIFWMCVLALSIASVFVKSQRLFSISLLISSVLVLALLAYTLGNYGIVSRFRAVVIIMLTPVALGTAINLSKNLLSIPALSSLVKRIKTIENKSKI